MRDESGAVAILVAAFSVVMFAFAAIVVDLGILRDTQGEAQSTVDAAALAGAGALYSPPDRTPHFDEAIAAVKRSASENLGITDTDWAGCSADIPSGWQQHGSGTSCIAFDDASPTSKLQVVLPDQRVGSAFGGIVGYSGATVSALAQATALGAAVPDCGLCVLGTVNSSGAIVVRGDSSFSAGSGRLGGGGSIFVEPNGIITFSARPNPRNSSAQYSPNPPSLGPVNDPYGGSAIPGPGGTAAASNNITCGTGPVNTLPAGVYRNVTVNGTCTASGVIRVTGRLRVTSGTLRGNSTLYFLCGSRTAPRACNSGESGGSLQIESAGALSISGPVGGYAVLYHPNNRAGLTVNGSFSTTRGLYARSATVSVGSFGDVGVSTFTAVGGLRLSTGTTVTVRATATEVTGPPEVALYQ